MTNIGRRHFLGGLISAALCERLLGKTKGDPVLRIGFISDSHVCLMMPDNNKALEKAFAYLAARNVDVVVISGDVTEFATPEEMQIVIDAWDKTFPGGRAADGRTTAKFIAWGNHDYACASYMGRMTPQQLRGAFPRMMIDDKAYCEECVRDRKMFKVIDPTNAVCKDCGFKDSPNYDVTFYKFGDDVVCDECLEKRLTECERDYSGFEA